MRAVSSLTSQQPAALHSRAAARHRALRNLRRRLYRQQIPLYSDVPARIAHENNRATLVLLVRRWERGEALDDADTEAIAERARQWAMTDFSFALIARTIQIGLRRVLAVVHEHAEELEIDARALLPMQDRVWDWATHISSVLSDVEREHAVLIARRDAVHRADFLRDLASGRVTAERLAREAAVYGLDLAQPYVAVRADVSDGAAASALEAKIRQSGATSEHRVFQTVVDGRLLAVAPQSPKAPADATLAVGSRCSYRTCTARSRRPKRRSRPRARSA
jgi:hypothetical protein